MKRRNFEHVFLLYEYNISRVSPTIDNTIEYFTPFFLRFATKSTHMSKIFNENSEYDQSKFVVLFTAQIIC